MSTTSTTISIGMTSPSSATTTAGTASSDISSYDHAIIHTVLTGGTGGTLDVYLQALMGGTEWCDVVHFPQLASGAAAIGYACSLTRHAAGAVPIAVNTVATTPVLAANVVVPGMLGSQLRVICVAGTSTSAGAAQVVTVELFGKP